jgi:hypothetical protein
VTPRALAGLAGVGLTLAACGGSPAPAPSAPKPVAAIPAPAATKPVAPPAAAPAPLVAAPAIPATGGPQYEAKGRRDPFVSLEVVGGPKGLEVATMKLTGIVRSARSTLALIEAQDGIGYILRPGDTLADGRLMEIGSDSVSFAVAAKPGSPTNRVVLKLAAN